MLGSARISTEIGATNRADICTDTAELQSSIPLHISSFFGKVNTPIEDAQPPLDSPK
jgi:hypothetical protein